MTDLPVNYPWLKFQLSLLDDPDFMLLSDAAAGIYIKLYLLAGKADAGGLLCNANKAYTVKDLIFLLRVDHAKMETYLAELADARLVDKEGDNYKIIRFMDEQGPGRGPAIEKAREEWRMRQQNHREKVKENIKEMDKIVDKIIDEIVDKRVTIVTSDNADVTVTDEKQEETATSPSSFVQRAQKFYTQITCRISLPSGEYTEILRRLDDLDKAGKMTADYITPFWTEQKKRYPHSTQSFFLDWAVTGEIPDQKNGKNGNGGGPKPSEPEGVEGVGNPQTWPSTKRMIEQIGPSYAKKSGNPFADELARRSEELRKQEEAEEQDKANFKEKYPDGYLDMPQGKVHGRMSLNCDWVHFSADEPIEIPVDVLPFVIRQLEEKEIMVPGWLSELEQEQRP